MKRVAIIGCGALAQVFSKNALVTLSGHVKLLGMFSRHPEKTQAVAAPLGLVTYTNFEEVLAAKPDIIVEFAGKEAVLCYAERALEQGIDFVAVSVGALADAKFLQRLESLAQKSNAHLYVPNGAIGGLDILQVYGLMGQAKVTIESVKGPRSLEGAPGLKGRGLSSQTRECVFEGGVIEAIAGFPKNVNVAVATALASASETTVRVVSDPTSLTNRHTITAQNATMKTTLEFVSSPDPLNPKSSVSAAWSVIALLKQLTASVRFF